MATHTWTGAAGDGSVSNASNWSGGVPVANGDVVFKDTAQSVTANLTALAAVAINSLNIYKSFTGNIGAAGSSMTMTVTGASPAVSRIATNRGYLYLGITTHSTMDLCVDEATGGGIFLTSGTIAKDLVCGRFGSLKVSGVTLSGSVYSAGMGIYSESAVANIYLRGSGSHVLALGNISSNLLIEKGSSVELRGSVTVDTISCGGTLNHGGTGTLTGVTLYPTGVFNNPGKNDNTITTLTMWDGSVATLTTPGAKTTVTNTILRVGGK